MKKSDIVVIDDDSWSRTVKDNKLVHGPDGDKHKQDRRQYIVIETGCRFPNTDSPDSYNNTIIQALDSGKVVFIEERFLRLAKLECKIMISVGQDKYIMFGKIIKISDELYKKIEAEQ